MEMMTEAEFQSWIQSHRGERGREPYYETQPVTGTDEFGDPTTEQRRVAVGTKVTAHDGATIIVKRTPESGQPGKADYVVAARMDAESPSANRTPDQQRTDAAQATAAEQTNALKQREQDERDWNQMHPEQGGSGLPETHLERSVREAKARDEARALQDQKDREAQQQRASAAQEEQNRQTAADRAQRATEFNVSSGISASSQAETVRHNQAVEAAQNRPSLVPGDSKSKYLTSYDPTTGQITPIENPNFDQAKADAEEKRAELTSQIASRQINLEEAKQQYTQWFDQNVRTPMMAAQEMRARAEERRQALDAEERRRQFAADFQLRKASLGQQAASTAIQAEESLLPYRAGPNEAAHMSDAINGLAAGGIVGGPSAGAGVHFQGEDFQFNAPDFKKIAAQATKQVLSGLTDYRPSDQQYPTGDYSGIPQVNFGAMPAYSGPVGSSSLPAPSAGADQPIQ